MRASASRAISYQFDHRFNDRWTFRQNARYVSSDVALKQVYGYGWANGTELNRYYSGADESLNAFAIDNQLQGKFETGAVKHTVLLGLDYQNRHADGRWDSGSASPAAPSSTAAWSRPASTCKTSWPMTAGACS
ncbi:hypothetical protein G6F24_016613 [Rhizopus arrhizus]|nr:hypothetical protein G6F24_016613 [Rhizopus arrhizus]